MRGGMRRRALFASLVLLAALFALAPRHLEGQTWKECVDGSFAGYNDCLVESGGWFERKLCDLDFELEVSLCTAKAVGEIRDAWNGNS